MCDVAITVFAKLALEVFVNVTLLFFYVIPIMHMCILDIHNYFDQHLPAIWSKGCHMNTALKGCAWLQEALPFNVAKAMDGCFWAIVEVLQAVNDVVKLPHVLPQFSHEYHTICFTINTVYIQLNLVITKLHSTRKCLRHKHIHYTQTTSSLYLLHYIW